MTSPTAALGQTTVCSKCGAVHWADRACPNCRLSAECRRLAAALEDATRRVADIEAGVDDVVKRLRPAEPAPEPTPYEAALLRAADLGWHHAGATAGGAA